MGYAVLHMEKTSGTDAAMSAHIERTIKPKNADESRTHLNRELIRFPNGVENRTQAIQHRLDTAGLTRKIGNNQVRAIRVLLTGTHEDMERITNEGRLDGWCSDNLKYLADTFGRENIVSAVLHMDEQTPHIHATLVPIVKGERKRKKKEQVKRRYRKKPTDAARLCADEIMTRAKLKSYQDTYAQTMSIYGLQRGIDGSEARHISTRQYYRDLMQQTEQLQTDIEQLQDRKKTAQEELRRAKKEVQTEKLKGAATTAATNIAESVGSLFGSNKVKTLERENAALQNRISELENETQEREKRQAKQIQEMKNAYEQQNRKLSEFVDFVKRYFPYVEKLIPTIKFLRETLNFGDAIIRKLCTFKDVSIKGELYSREFNRHFKTDSAVCSLKQDAEGRFELNIDGVSHISWFRRKKDEFMEALGIPTKRQNRGIKL
ncbi:mobilization protein [Parabacteroides sp. CH2-D42-20]|jgi:predicted Rdx family selenoprotein|uniref:Mobilization protein n=1 Tax=Bacteroides acidifaciens TaxID=85831 RepID=A0A3L7YZ53_9BACE|nr:MULTISPECIES: MobV family relaxase [Bacteroidales]NBH68565.1 mobilization protein [Phocaeicola sartorii]RLT69736.1 mobilization protein [Parabacteroides sp. CH2-D42-20]RLT77247.1 mobilization protein [bacterium J10(2018)]RLT78404.1 mobilization protein [Bacteroides acidifaciens]